MAYKLPASNTQLIFKVTLQSGNYIASTSDSLIGVTSGSPNVTITLPSPTACQVGQTFIVQDEGGNAGTNNIYVNNQPPGAINGSFVPQRINTNYGVIRVYSNGTNFFIW